MCDGTLGVISLSPDEAQCDQGCQTKMIFCLTVIQMKPKFYTKFLIFDKNKKIFLHI